MIHTPGPWTVTGLSENMAEAEVIEAANRTIAWTTNTYLGADAELSAFTPEEIETANPYGEIVTHEDRANARLIAAAPEMYDVLVDLIEQIEAYDRLHGPDSCAISPDAAIAAVAKAEGRVWVPDEVPDSMEQFLEWEFLYELCEECHGDTRHHSAIWIEGARDADLGHHWVVVCIEANRGHAVCKIDECEEHPGEKGLALYV